MTIIDVNFRYALRIPEGREEHPTHQHKVPVLQWRKKSKFTYPGIVRDEEIECWTDWQDVKTEEE